MNSILTNQNKPENIKKLAAQRQLYKEAKKFLIIQILLTVPITISISILKLILKETIHVDISEYAAFYGILLSIVDVFVFNKLIGTYRTNAAKTQEEFDCDVYNMEWNKIFVGKKVGAEVINKYSRKYFPLENAPLNDWYPIEIGPFSLEHSILICQKTNLYYDTALRKKYKTTSIVLAGITFVLLMIISLSTKISVPNFLVQVILPFLPVFILAFKIIEDHSKAVKAAVDLHQTIENLADIHNSLSVHLLRKVQDKIYCNRKDSPLIPDFFYKEIRTKLEDEMHENASNI
jgi:SMODS-associating 4TM effector domain